MTLDKKWIPFDIKEYNKKEYERKLKHPILYHLDIGFWAVYRFCRFKLPYLHKNIIYFFQRGFRGWADCDTWSLDTYLDKVIRDSVEYLRVNKHGYPMDLTEEKWDDILHRISFLADRHLGMIEMDFEYTKKEYDETTKELFELLSKYWVNLWD